MTKLERYETEVRKIARQIEGNRYTRVVLEDITSRTEKGFINKLIKKYDSDIKAKTRIEMDATKEQKLVSILNSRMETLNK